MAGYQSMSKEQLQKEKSALEVQYAEFKAKNLKLDMSRGKPGADQLDLSMEILNCLSSDDMMKTADGMDVRNYGGLDGIPEAKALFAEMLGVKTSELFIGGNSSLNLMYDTMARAMLFGVYGSEKPWGKYDKVKFLCPVPGYDRHFGVCEDLGLEMVNIPMLADGPDMDLVESLIRDDETIKGIWSVPMYSNPEGITYSDKVVRRFANLKPAAKDFRIFWDNAYCLHHLTDDHPKLLNLFEECKKTGNEDMVYVFTSFSKVTFPGASISALAASENNLKEIKKHLSMQTIGSDKMNQYRHVRYFGDIENVKAHMLKHRAIIKPKFDVVLNTLKSELNSLGIASWTEPKGGYFISVSTQPGCAKRTVALCKEAGVTLTPAGAPFPYGIDPEDRVIRLAPTFPSVEELRKAIQIFCTAAKLAAIEKAEK